jgi:hypothetical protein
MNPVVHLEFHMDDPPQARDLDAELCGWRPQGIETRGGSYLSSNSATGSGEASSSAAPGARCGCPASTSPRSAMRPTGRAGWGASVLLEPREGPALS